MSFTRNLLARQYIHSIWTQLPLFVIGLWLIAGPFTLAYESNLLAASDMICGMLILILVMMAMAHKGAWISWVIAAIGGWLLMAPLLFWAPTAAAYANDTTIGLLVMGFSVVIPYMRHMPGPNIPADWTYNPSSWDQRLPIVILAFIGFLIAHYMSAYQLGHIRTVWDPFFSPGTRAVLESDVSRAWPVSDAGLGAVSYALDAIAGLIGSTRRWRTMPWIVILFGVFILPLGIVSITLVILQPVSVGAWCTLCLMSALISMLMIPFAVDEVAASIQFLVQARRSGRSVWKTFWFGGSAQPGSGLQERPINLAELRRAFADVMLAPWNLALSVLVGAWVMIMPAVFGLQGMAANGNHIAGALAITFAVIAFMPITRIVRFLNVLVGLWLVAGFWMLEPDAAAQWIMAITGVVLILLSLGRGRVDARFGIWDALIV